LELRRLSKDITPLLTTIHPSWLQFIKPDDFPPYTTNSYATLTKASAANNPSNKCPGIHIPDILPTSDALISPPLDIVEINDHKTLLHQTIYNVNQLKTEHFTAIHRCHHIRSGLTPELLTRVHPEDEDTPILSIPFGVT
jgi:hypothetical protein